MGQIQVEYATEAERVAIERAIEFVKQTQQQAQDAQFGQVLNSCESFVSLQGQILLRLTLQDALQARLTQAEQEGGC